MRYSAARLSGPKALATLGLLYINGFCCVHACVRAPARYFWLCFIFERERAVCRRRILWRSAFCMLFCICVCVCVFITACAHPQEHTPPTHPLTSVACCIGRCALSPHFPFSAGRARTTAQPQPTAHQQQY